MCEVRSVVCMLSCEGRIINVRTCIPIWTHTGVSANTINAVALVAVNAGAVIYVGFAVVS